MSVMLEKTSGEEVIAALMQALSILKSNYKLLVYEVGVGGFVGEVDELYKVYNLLLGLRDAVGPDDFEILWDKAIAPMIAEYMNACREKGPVLSFKRSVNKVWVMYDNLKGDPELKRIFARVKFENFMKEFFGGCSPGMGGMLLWGSLGRLAEFEYRFEQRVKPHFGSCGSFLEHYAKIRENLHDFLFGFRELSEGKLIVATDEQEIVIRRLVFSIRSWLRQYSEGDVGEFEADGVTRLAALVESAKERGLWDKLKFTVLQASRKTESFAIKLAEMIESMKNVKELPTRVKRVPGKYSPGIFFSFAESMFLAVPTG